MVGEVVRTVNGCQVVESLLYPNLLHKGKQKSVKIKHEEIVEKKGKDLTDEKYAASHPRLFFTPRG